MEARLKPGTLVFVSRPTTEHKLAHRFAGPYFISRDASVAEGAERSAASYIVKDESGREFPDTRPRDRVFQVPQEKVRMSARQAEMYHREEMQEKVRTVKLIRPGPIPKGKEGESHRYVVERIEGVRKGKKGGKGGLNALVWL